MTDFPPFSHEVAPSRDGSLTCGKVVAFVATAVMAWSVQSAAAAAAFPSDQVEAFTDQYCSSCHNDVDKEADLDLTTLKFNPADPSNFGMWVKVHDRVQNGEMPPKEKKTPDA